MAAIVVMFSLCIVATFVLAEENLCGFHIFVNTGLRGIPAWKEFWRWEEVAFGTLTSYECNPAYAFSLNSTESHPKSSFPMSMVTICVDNAPVDRKIYLIHSIVNAMNATAGFNQFGLVRENSYPTNGVFVGLLSNSVTSIFLHGVHFIAFGIAWMRGDYGPDFGVNCRNISIVFQLEIQSQINSLVIGPFGKKNWVDKRNFTVNPGPFFSLHFIQLPLHGSQLAVQGNPLESGNYSQDNSKY